MPPLKLKPASIPEGLTLQNLPRSEFLLGDRLVSGAVAGRCHGMTADASSPLCGVSVLKAPAASPIYLWHASRPGIVPLERYLIKRFFRVHDLIFSPKERAGAYKAGLTRSLADTDRISCRA